MQFIYATGDHTVFVRPEVPEIVNDKGQMLHPKKKRLFAKFRRGIPTPFLATAQEKFPKWDRHERPLSTHGGFFDTEMERGVYNWDDEETRLVEEFLLERPHIFRVELAKAPLPYPTYLKQRKVQGKRTIQHVITDILATLAQTGIDAGLVTAYERDFADDNSDAIIAAVSAQPEPEPEEELIAA